MDRIESNISGKIARLEGTINDMVRLNQNTVDDWEYWVLVEELRNLKDIHGWASEEHNI